jgi:hypothetical protein
MRPGAGCVDGISGGGGGRGEEAKKLGVDITGTAIVNPQVCGVGWGGGAKGGGVLQGRDGRGHHWVRRCQPTGGAGGGASWLGGVGGVCMKGGRWGRRTGWGDQRGQ